jgi:GxxExxY protein
MNADERRQELDKITEKVIGCVYAVSKQLGNGFLEKVYENALCIELSKVGLIPKQQYLIKVYYDGAIVGDFSADILVNDVIILELKAVKSLDEIHQAQCMNYLRATGLTVCLLINFGKPKAEVKRIVHQF